MAQPIKLNANPREILGKQVKKLRREGLVPANIFGQGLKSTAVQVDLKDFVKVYQEVGETGLVEVKVGEKAHPVLVHRIQKDPRTSSVLHVDFHQVNLKEKTTAHVPVVLTGESPIEKSGDGLILQTLNEIEVEALPTDIPHNVEVDITTLTEVGQSIQVKDLKVNAAQVEVKNDAEATVVSVQSAEVKEEEPVEAPAEVEVIGEKEAEGEAGEAAEGDGAKESKEAPAEEAKPKE